jgi:DNA-binding response OmpR family regulator
MSQGIDQAPGVQHKGMSPAPRPPHKVLVIDDSAICREPLLAALKLKGFDALGAADGERGLALIRSENPDLVVLDVMMPEMDGWSVLRVLRRSPQLVELPVILLTATVDVDCVSRAREFGVREYLLKEQFSIEDLYARIRKGLGLAPDGGPAPAQPDAATLAKVVASTSTLKATIAELSAILKKYPQLAGRLLEAADANATSSAKGAGLSGRQAGAGARPEDLDRAMRDVLVSTIRNIASAAAAA